MYIASQEEKLKYCDWRILNLNRSNSYLEQGIKLMISNEFNEMILLSDNEITDFNTPKYSIKLIGHIQNGMVRNENAFIYKITRNNLVDHRNLLAHFPFHTLHMYIQRK